MSDTDATQARQDVVAEVDEIIEHVINANMLSMPYDVYSELFDAVDGLGVEIENLKAENAKLRERIDSAHMSRLLTENENESLRELCADMLHDAMENICSKAHWCDEKSWQTCNDEKCGNRLYVETARELGVEVP